CGARNRPSNPIAPQRFRQTGFRRTDWRRGAGSYAGRQLLALAADEKSPLGAQPLKAFCSSPRHPQGRLQRDARTMPASDITDLAFVGACCQKTGNPVAKRGTIQNQHHLRALQSADYRQEKRRVERLRLVDMVGVTGSIPVPPTSL